MIRLPALLASAALVAACVGGSTAQPTSPGPTASPTATASSAPTQSTSPAGTIELARSDVSRSIVDPAQAAAAADALNAFGVDMYARIATEPGNIVISPASIAIALSMAQAGARATTADEMDTVLHGLGSDELADAANALDAALAARNGTFKDLAGVDQEVALRIANALFVQHDMALEAAYLDAMAARYGAGLWTVDYASDPEAARLAINAWVAEHTENRIEDILHPGQVTPMTRLALVNAIYLKAAWLAPFDKEETQPGSFTLVDGASVQVPLMHRSARFGYGAGEGWQAVELPYVGGNLAMTVILPDDLAAFEDSFDAARLVAIVASLERTEVVLTMPTFDTETRADLGPLLVAMGMPTAFDPLAADFSGLTTEAQLFIQAVIHKANITVDEAGTEAAAATVILMGDTSGPGSPPIELRVDRPFLFVLRDVPTGAVVFMGRVADPSLTR
jgi:serpin B